MSISSTGRLSARSTVTIGSQVSGEISTVLVDFNDSVTKGQVIARINPARYEAQLNSATAALLGAEASLQRSLDYASQVDRDFTRKEDLAKRKLISRSDYEQSRDEKSKALLQIKIAQSSIKALQASVISARYDLDQTIIRSPVDGVILERLIEPGQTVAASFETPILFRIAEDLSKMKIELSVDEADIGGIQDGNEVQFSVDAFPERNFAGTVIQKRIAPNIQGNNATYPVIVSVTNSDGVLIPGMLADATIYVTKRENTLKLPNNYIEVESNTGNHQPSFHEIQKAVQSNIQYLSLSEKQFTLFRKISKNELPESSGQVPPPADLVNFFGAAAASNIVIIDGTSGDLDTTIKRNRLKILRQNFSEFRMTLTDSQRVQWDQLLTDLIDSRFARVWIGNGKSVTARSVLIGISDESSTQILYGITPKDVIKLPAPGDR